MGLNAQTAVPEFQALEVLTAAEMTQINTGIPVFATTTTRDAAFSGAGEKVLAEGQFAYIEATNTTQFYDGAAWLALGGKIGQVVSATYNTATTTTSTTFVTTGLSASITPTATSSKVYIFATTFGYQNTINSAGTFTLFRGTVAGTNLATGATPFMAGGYSGAGDLQFTVACQFLDSPNTTSATTYTLGFRTGNAATTITAQKDTAQASIILMEVLA